MTFDRLKHSMFAANVRENGIAAWFHSDFDPDSRTASFFLLIVMEALVKGFGALDEPQDGL